MLLACLLRFLRPLKLPVRVDCAGAGGLAQGLLGAAACPTRASCKLQAAYGESAQQAGSGSRDCWGEGFRGRRSNPQSSAQKRGAHTRSRHYSFTAGQPDNVMLTVQIASKSLPYGGSGGCDPLLTGQAYPTQDLLVPLLTLRRLQECQCGISAVAICIILVDSFIILFAVAWKRKPTAKVSTLCLPHRSLHATKS